MMVQKYFKQQGSGEQQSWYLAFENGYIEGFKKTHRRQWPNETLFGPPSISIRSVAINT
jgi:hypothetical protein